MTIVWPDDAIAAIKTEYETRAGVTFANWAVGNVDAAKLTSCPRVCWMPISGKPAKQAPSSGGNPRRLTRIEDLWELWLWHSTRDYLWELRQSLEACSLTTELGAMVRFGDHVWRHEQRTGTFAMGVHVTFDLLLVDVVTPTKVVTDFIGDIMMNDELFASWPTPVPPP
jgi:hypothetical protein